MPTACWSRPRCSSSARGALIEARVDSVDRAANKLVVLGIDVTVNANTRIEDKGDQRVPNFNVGNITAGDFVEVRGAELPAQSNDVVASRLERRRPDREVRLRGIVDTVSRPSFTILGVTIQTNAGTDFEGVAAGRILRRRRGSHRHAQVKGTVSGGVCLPRAKWSSRTTEPERDGGALPVWPPLRPGGKAAARASRPLARAGCRLLLEVSCAACVDLPLRFSLLALLSADARRQPSAHRATLSDRESFMSCGAGTTRAWRLAVADLPNRDWPVLREFSTSPLSRIRLGRCCLLPGAGPVVRRDDCRSFLADADGDGSGAVASGCGRRLRKARPSFYVSRTLELQAIAQSIDDSFVQPISPTGKGYRVAGGQCALSITRAASSTLFRMCNRWTAERLQLAGCSVRPRLVMTASQAITAAKRCESVTNL